MVGEESIKDDKGRAKDYESNENKPASFSHSCIAPFCGQRRRPKPRVRLYPTRA